MKKRKYTIKMHVYRLKLMLEKSKKSNMNKYCPAATGFSGMRSPSSLWKRIDVFFECRSFKYPCSICREFFIKEAIREEVPVHLARTCPCNIVLDSKKVREISLKAIERYERKDIVKDIVKAMVKN